MTRRETGGPAGFTGGARRGGGLNGHVVALSEFVPGVVEVGDEGVAFGAGAGYYVHDGRCVSAPNL